MEHLAFTFEDRADAGRQLGEILAKMELDRPLIYALPRGGVPVAVEIAKRIGAPLDLLMVRKIGAPRNPEVALGAIVEGATHEFVVNEDVRRMSGADETYVSKAVADQRAELERRRKRYLGDRARLDPEGRCVIVVDDGLATGATMKAALIGLKRGKPARIVVALPVAPKPALDEISGQSDDVVCLKPVTAFRGVGGFYRDFRQLSDEETVALLCQVPSDSIRTAKARATGTHKRNVEIPPLGLPGDLTVPPDPRGIVIFAHGSGSSRRSPRNVYVADKLNANGFATLLFDLLSPEEGKNRRNVFDIPLLADRVVEASMWVTSEPDLEDLPTGLFGASTGAGAALVAAAELKGRVAAVVSRGGRPDLAKDFLSRVRSPTLLIVGSLDRDVIPLNEKALAALRCPKELEIVPGASHLFEERGTLDDAVDLAATWFRTHLRAQVPAQLGPVPPTGVRSPRSILRAAAVPLSTIDDPTFADAFDRFGSKRVVLLGEASHGTTEFYRARAAITRRLIEDHGFSIVAVEADWPDAAAVDRHIRHKPHSAMKTPPFARFPTWMWRNVEFDAFTRNLRQYNGARAMEERVAFYGLDLYNMNASIAAVLSYLDRVDEGAATVARSRYGCLSEWVHDPAAYGRAALTQGFSLCEEPVTRILMDLLKKQLDYAARDGDLFFDATQNARLVANAERYYRMMYYGSQVSWNLRDKHMFHTLRQILNHAGPSGKAVVWAHNSHIGDARHTDMGRVRGELNIGQLCREEYGDETALIGFGTASGTVAAASEWDAPMQIKTVRPPRPDSYESLCQDVDLERFVWDFGRSGVTDLRRVLSKPRLQRYIGVIYRPETERASHYSYATLPEQYDAFVWFNRTHAVTPLPTLTNTIEDETYPFGL
ncbi:Erythromycin esterase homolog [Jannaschia faecimaris]|uniref:Erythromycin esterase homolog n=1 Tax=Jannaschia faecimaris TaxID=1244108 RepID=A0A1H3Q073_9RHOB|nr:erythromycin esterase family protein [Jannaschia faecimaris]SDZ06922.1 Erythromycin esterase homolog [Jannaschia faecimaris]